MTIDIGETGQRDEFGILRENLKSHHVIKKQKELTLEDLEKYIRQHFEIALKDILAQQKEIGDFDDVKGIRMIIDVGRGYKSGWK